MRGRIRALCIPGWPSSPLEQKERCRESTGGDRQPAPLLWSICFTTTHSEWCCPSSPQMRQRGALSTAVSAHTANEPKVLPEIRAPPPTLTEKEGETEQRLSSREDGDRSWQRRERRERKERRGMDGGGLTQVKVSGDDGMDVEKEAGVAQMWASPMQIAPQHWANQEGWLPLQRSELPSSHEEERTRERGSCKRQREEASEREECESEE